MMLDEAVADRHMRELAALVLDAPLRTTPNPRVGCRIVSADGEVLAQGIHGEDGLHHAEVIALEQAGERAYGATAIVTLEPCAHYGKTPPCVDALIAAGVAEVIYSHSDLSAAAGGDQKLRDAGIAVQSAVALDATEPLIESWRHFQNTGRPFVTLKLASTLDGYIAAPDGTSRWITGAAARSYVHRVRARVDAVLVGTGTVIADDPALDVRLEGDWPQPQPYVMGRRAIPETAKLHGRARHIAHHDVDRALAELAADGVQHVLIEGGAEVAAAFLRLGRVDALLWFTAPKLLGGGRRAVEGLAVPTIALAQEWTYKSQQMLGEDLLQDLRPVRVAG